MTRLVDRLQRRFGRLAIPNLTLMLIVVQVAVYLLTWGHEEMREGLLLVPSKVLAGQWWRLLTVLFAPPLTNPLFAFFFWYLFYMMGTTLEVHWGTFRYNLYLWVGYLATTAVAFLTPDAPATNGFLYGTVFLAFAHLFPNFELMLFFILPVKIKWLALLAWIGYGYAFLTGGLYESLAVAAAVANFLLFFGRDIYDRMRSGRRRMRAQIRSVTAQREPFHRCRVCGITDISHPQTEFRYCSKCDGTCGYCPEHLKNHEHVVRGDTAPADMPAAASGADRPTALPDADCEAQRPAG